MPIRNACKNHPDREGKVYCQKFNRWYCGDCIACSQPKAYCKYRTACMIWEFQKYGIPDEFKEHHDAEEAEDPVADAPPAQSATEDAPTTHPAPPVSSEKATPPPSQLDASPARSA